MKGRDGEKEGVGITGFQRSEVSISLILLRTGSGETKCFCETKPI